MTITARFDDALATAVELHRDQPRKGSGIPYLSHLLAVTAIVMESGGDEDQMIGALLHDSIEDAGDQISLDEIKTRFGEEVAQIVDGCTDTDQSPKPPWRERKEAYLRHLPSAPASVKLVSCADKVHNARSILRDYRNVGEAIWDRFKGGRDGTLWYYRSLVEIFRETNDMPLVDEFDETVTRIEQLAACDGLESRVA